MKRVILLAVVAGLNSAVLHAGPPTAPPGFARCQACHATVVGAPARAGPILWGVVDARAGSRAAYAYSSALRGSRIVWTRAALRRYLADPAATVPGTRMPKVAMTPAERDALVTYLAALK
ncbi:MAG TPA: c-type cytochrome [Novosphingobium sp.]|nr:c-type cytochrome [Novosphingobium sp.]